MLVLSAALFLGALIGLERQDDGWLLRVGGQPMDARGTLAAAWDDAWRGCRDVRRLLPGDPSHASAAQALRGYSPPDSLHADVLQVQALGPWRLVQARFDRLEPVVVVVHDDGAAVVLPHAVWSGPTVPWHPAWRIRGFLAQRAPEVPAALIDCLDPLPLFTTAAPDRRKP